MPSRFPFDARKSKVFFDYLASGCSVRAALGQAEIAPDCFRYWMATDRPVFAEFQTTMRKNRSYPLAMAEMEVFRNDKKLWLRYGPGGWTGQPRAKSKAAQEPAKPIDLRHLPEWWRFRRAVMHNLEKEPELRQRLAAAFAEMAEKSCSA